MIKATSSKIPTLSKRELAYCTLRAKGENKSRAYLMSGYKAKDIHQAGSMACTLEKKPKIVQYLETLKTSAAVQTVLSVEAKRKFLHDLVHANPLDPDLPGHLIQEARTEVDPAGNIKKVIKLPSKIEAIRTDNNMAGDNWSDKVGADQVNPFSFLVQFFSPSSPALPVPSPTLPELPPVLDAEIVPPVTP